MLAFRQTWKEQNEAKQRPDAGLGRTLAIHLATVLFRSPVYAPNSGFLKLIQKDYRIPRSYYTVEWEEGQQKGRLSGLDCGHKQMRPGRLGFVIPTSNSIIGSTVETGN